MVKRVSKRVSKQVSKRSRKRSRNRSKQRRSKRNSRRRVSKRRSRKHVSKRRSRKRVSKRRSRKRVKHMKGGADDFLKMLETAVRSDSESVSAGAATIEGEGEGERERIFNLISGAHPNFKEALDSEDTGVYENEQLRKKYKEALDIYFPLYESVKMNDANSEIIIQQLRIIYPHKFSHDDDEVVRRQLRVMVAELITKIERLERLEP
jgi:hypothetical protein